MRVAVVNPLHGQPYAESCLEARFLAAGRNLGWTTAACPSAEAVEAFAADFVLSIHTSTPKQTDHVWYGCMWHPPGHFGYETERQALQQDGYLVASDSTRAWLLRLIGPDGPRRVVGEIQTSVNQTPYRPANYSRPRLLYAGVNWDGHRHEDLFARLDGVDWLDIYGPPEAWAHTPRSFRGMLPFDGVSVIDALRAAGAGLCLHSDMHRRAGTPSLRIFEIAAAGAVVIAQRHPFIEQHSGDSVLFLDESRPAEDEVARYMEWIRRHPAECARLTARAHRVLAERFTLERLLSRLPSAHRRFLANVGRMTY